MALVSSKYVQITVTSRTPRIRNTSTIMKLYIFWYIFFKQSLDAPYGFCFGLELPAIQVSPTCSARIVNFWQQLATCETNDTVLMLLCNSLLPSYCSTNNAFTIHSIVTIGGYVWWWYLNWYRTYAILAPVMPCKSKNVESLIQPVQSSSPE